MDTFILIPIFVMIVLVLVVSLRRSAPKLVRSRGITLLCLAGSAILGVSIVAHFFGVWFVVGELDFSGLVYQIPTITLIVITCLAWVRPLESGVVLIVSGMVTRVVMGEGTIFPFEGTPYIVAGLLFLAAGLIGRKKMLAQRVEEQPTGPGE